MPVVIHTNVLVSALLSRASPPAELVALARRTLYPPDRRSPTDGGAGSRNPLPEASQLFEIGGKRGARIEAVRCSGVAPEARGCGA